MNTDSLQQAQNLVADDLDAVENLLTGELTSRAQPITRASAHLIASGGKRIRALLCLLSAHATGFPPKSAQRLACCAELLHAASLCHDDVLDSGELRRGRPTVRAVFGNPMSILLGDYCLAQAFRMLADDGFAAAGSAAARVVTAMAEGEVMQAMISRESSTDVSRYHAIADAKTGALFTWCVSLGGLVPAPHLEALEKYGRHFGRIYQMADDILDFDTDERTGKAAGQDILGGENTLPVILACSARPELAVRLHELRLASVADEQEVISLTEAIRKTGAFDQARDAALAESERAVKALSGLPDTPHRSMLAAMAGFAAVRHA